MDTNFENQTDVQEEQTANQEIPHEISYKGFIIRFFKEQTNRYFAGYYVGMIWFPALERAKMYIDRQYNKISDHEKSQLYGG